MSITTDNRHVPKMLAIEDHLHLWGATQALSPERAAELHGHILSAALEADEAANAAEEALSLTNWLLQEMSALRTSLQHSLSLDNALAVCGPEALRAAIGPQTGA